MKLEAYLNIGIYEFKVIGLHYLNVFISTLNTYARAHPTARNAAHACAYTPF